MCPDSVSARGFAQEPWRTGNAGERRPGAGELPWEMAVKNVSPSPGSHASSHGFLPLDTLRCLCPAFCGPRPQILFLGWSAVGPQLSCRSSHK